MLVVIADQGIANVSRHLDVLDYQKVEIVCATPDIRPYAALGIEGLQASADREIIIKDIAGDPLSKSLARALVETSVGAAQGRADLRFGMKFFDRASGQLSVAIYIDRWGRDGYLNGERVTFNSAIQNWAKNNVTICFKG